MVKTMIICSKYKCSNKHYAKGLCLFHYNRNRKRDYNVNPRKCSISGCNQSHHAHGFCHSHYMKNNEKTCSIPNCKNTVRARGICIAHYNEWYINKNFPYRKNCKQKSCVICGYSKIINIHHIISKGKGGNDESTNLVALCPNHHMEVHRNMIKIPENIQVEERKNARNLI